MFPKDFIWGVACSSYQTEGAWNEDGKGKSIWDDFCHRPDNIKNNETGDVACDSYHLYKEDINLLAKTSATAYRFSISWSRVMPKGIGEINKEGLAYYDNVINYMNSKNIKPYVTLYHWDLPSALEEKGGWLNRETAYAFAEFAGIIAKHFDGRVSNYITINEPQCAVCLGYDTGEYAPGKKLSLNQQLICMHNLLLAHGLATSSIRANSTKHINISLASTGRLYYPAEHTDKHIASAKSKCFTVTNDNWSFSYAWVLDAVVNGKYPDSDNDEINSFAANAARDDMTIISTPIDYLCLNIYNGRETDIDGKEVKRYRGFPKTALKWPITPEVMRYGVRFIYERYKKPIYITENGVSCNDKIYLDGKVHDLDRIDFLERYLDNLNCAIYDGADVRGYFHWSLTDNFEWSNGYDERLGLIYIDYNDMKRIPKDSFYWYSEYIRKNSIY